MIQKSEILKRAEFPRGENNRNYNGENNFTSHGRYMENERLLPILTQLLDAHERLRVALTDASRRIASPLSMTDARMQLSEVEAVCVGALLADDALLDKIARGDK